MLISGIYYVDVTDLPVLNMVLRPFPGTGHLHFASIFDKPIYLDWTTIDSVIYTFYLTQPQK